MNQLPRNQQLTNKHKCRVDSSKKKYVVTVKESQVVNENSFILQRLFSGMAWNG